MIESFRHKGLRELLETGRSSKVATALQQRILVRLDVLEAAISLESLNRPGFDLHKLHGKPTRFSIHVNGPWCLTFEWREGRAIRVDLENYH